MAAAIVPCDGKYLALSVDYVYKEEDWSLTNDLHLDRVNFPSHVNWIDGKRTGPHSPVYRRTLRS